MSNLPSNGEILLSVRDAETGAPLGGADVEWIVSPDSSKTLLATDAQGQCRFALTQQPPRHVSARISAAGHVPMLVGWNTRHAEFQHAFELKIEKALTIGGIVTDEAARPIEGAEARIIIFNGSTDGAVNVRCDIWERKAVTDARGQWTFDGAPAVPGHVSVQVWHPEFVMDDETRERAEPQQYFDRTAAVVMKCGRVIEGVVKDTEGAPLADVAVLMHEHGSDSTTKPGYATDASGRFVIRNAPERTPLRCGAGEDVVLLTFFKSGRAPEHALVQTGPEPAHVDITLPPARILRGCVVDADGQPLGGAMVAPVFWRGYQPFRIRLRTDADGRFVWEDAPADEVIFDILAEGQASLRGLPLMAGDSEIRIVMRRPLDVRARVVDAETGEPIPAFQIIAGVLWPESRTHMGHRGMRAGTDGKFEVQFSEPARLRRSTGSGGDDGAHVIRVTAPGYVQSDSRPIRDTEESVELVFELRRGREAAFVVVTRHGRPVGGAVAAVCGEGNPVQIVDGAIRDHGDWVCVTTGTDGMAALPPQPGNPRLVVAHPEFGFANLTVEETQQGRVALTAWGTVRVKSTVARAGGRSPFYLSYEPLACSVEVRDYDLSSMPAIPGDGAVVFKGVRPGSARVGTFGRPDDEAVIVDVPEGGEATAEIELPDGVMGIMGRLNLPPDLAWVDWSRQHGALRRRWEPPKSPENPAPGNGECEGLVVKRMVVVGDGSLHRAEIMPDGAFTIPSAPPGKYDFELAIFSEPVEGAPQKLIGMFQSEVTIPTQAELDALMGSANSGSRRSPFESSFAMMQLDPPFHRCLDAGDRLPDFSAEALTGAAFDSAALRGKRAIVVFWASLPDKLHDLSDDINRTTAAAGAKGIAVHAINSDWNKATATKSLSAHPLACDVAWLGPDENRERLKKFGPMFPITIFAIGSDGIIRGCFESAAAALASFEEAR